MTNTTVANNLYPIANGTSSSNPFVDQFETRDPTPNDVNFPIQKKWLNTVTNDFWELKSFNSFSGVTTANWIKIAGSSFIESLKGNDGVVVPPTGNIINVVGDGTYITTVGNAGTSTLTIEPAGGLATVYDENSGTATPSGGVLNVVGGTGITTTGSGNTITITATGAGDIQSVEVDAHTNPGTNPVLPNGSGVITVTGGQVAASTTSNVIRTDSLAANTYTIQVQRSQAVASSTIGDNGVSHFNSSNFTVDANGFVSLNSSGIFSVNVQKFTTTGTYTPTTGMIYCLVECLGGGGAGGGATMTGVGQSSVGGGGGAGEYARAIFNAATIGASESVTIGAAGAASSGASGGNGGNTSVGSTLISAFGGGGGTTAAASSGEITGASGAGGTGGTGPAGYLATPGGPGFFGLGVASNLFAFSGQGSNSQYGSGGAGFVVQNPGNNALGYGAGGSGGANGESQSAVSGGNGTAGIVIITEFMAL